MSRFVRRTLAGAAVAAGIFAFIGSAGAQEVRSRITQPIDTSHLARLAGNTHPLGGAAAAALKPPLPPPCVVDGK